MSPPKSPIPVKSFPRIKLTRNDVRVKFGIGDFVRILGASETPFIGRILELFVDRKQAFFAKVRWMYQKVELPERVAEKCSPGENELFWSEHDDITPAESLLETVRIRFEHESGEKVVCRCYSDAREVDLTTISPSFSCSRMYDVSNGEIRPLPKELFTQLKTFSFERAPKSKSKRKRPEISSENGVLKQAKIGDGNVDAITSKAQENCSSSAADCKTIINDNGQTDVRREQSPTRSSLTDGLSEDKCKHLAKRLQHSLVCEEQCERPYCAAMKRMLKHVQQTMTMSSRTLSVARSCSCDVCEQFDEIVALHNVGCGDGCKFPDCEFFAKIIGHGAEGPCNGDGVCLLCFVFKYLQMKHTCSLSEGTSTVPNRCKFPRCPRMNPKAPVAVGIASNRNLPVAGLHPRTNSGQKSHESTPHEDALVVPHSSSSDPSITMIVTDITSEGRTAANSSPVPDRPRSEEPQSIGTPSPSPPPLESTPRSKRAILGAALGSPEFEEARIRVGVEYQADLPTLEHQWPTTTAGDEQLWTPNDNLTLGEATIKSEFEIELMAMLRTRGTVIPVVFQGDRAKAMGYNAERVMFWARVVEPLDSSRQLRIVPYDAVWPKSRSPADFSVNHSQRMISICPDDVLLPEDRQESVLMRLHGSLVTSDGSRDMFLTSGPSSVLAEWTETEYDAFLATLPWALDGMMRSVFLASAREKGSTDVVELYWMLQSSMGLATAPTGRVPCSGCDRSFVFSSLLICRRFFSCSKAICRDCYKEQVKSAKRVQPAVRLSALKIQGWARLDETDCMDWDNGTGQLKDPFSAAIRSWCFCEPCMVGLRQKYEASGVRSLPTSAINVPVDGKETVRSDSAQSTLSGPIRLPSSEDHGSLPQASNPLDVNGSKRMTATMEPSADAAKRVQLMSESTSNSTRNSENALPENTSFTEGKGISGSEPIAAANARLQLIPIVGTMAASSADPTHVHSVVAKQGLTGSVSAPKVDPVATDSTLDRLAVNSTSAASSTISTSTPASNSASPLSSPMGSVTPTASLPTTAPPGLASEASISARPATKQTPIAPQTAVGSQTTSNQDLNSSGMLAAQIDPLKPASVANKRSSTTGSNPAPVVTAPTIAAAVAEPSLPLRVSSTVAFPLAPPGTATTTFIALDKTPKTEPAVTPTSTPKVDLPKEAVPATIVPDAKPSSDVTLTSKATVVSKTPVPAPSSSPGLNLSFISKPESDPNVTAKPESTAQTGSALVSNPSEFKANVPTPTTQKLAPTGAAPTSAGNVAAQATVSEPVLTPAISSTAKQLPPPNPAVPVAAPPVSASALAVNAAVTSSPSLGKPAPPVTAPPTAVLPSKPAPPNTAPPAAVPPVNSTVPVVVSTNSTGKAAPSVAITSTPTPASSSTGESAPLASAPPIPALSSKRKPVPAPPAAAPSSKPAPPVTVPPAASPPSKPAPPVTAPPAASPPSKPTPPVTMPPAASPSSRPAPPVTAPPAAAPPSKPTPPVTVPPAASPSSKPAPPVTAPPAAAPPSKPTPPVTVPPAASPSSRPAPPVTAPPAAAPPSKPTPPVTAPLNALPQSKEKLAPAPPAPTPVPPLNSAGKPLPAQGSTPSPAKPAPPVTAPPTSAAKPVPMGVSSSSNGKPAPPLAPPPTRTAAKSASGPSASTPISPVTTTQLAAKPVPPGSTGPVAAAKPVPPTPVVSGPFTKVVALEDGATTTSETKRANAPVERVSATVDLAQGARTAMQAAPAAVSGGSPRQRQHSPPRVANPVHAAVASAMKESVSAASGVISLAPASSSSMVQAAVQKALSTGNVEGNDQPVPASEKVHPILLSSSSLGAPIAKSPEVRSRAPSIHDSISLNFAIARVLRSYRNGDIAAADAMELIRKEMILEAQRIADLLN